MDIDSLTIGELKQLQLMLGKSTVQSPYEVGKQYFIRTVTMALVGKLESVGDKELVLSDASWIADTGRFHDSLRDGKFNEVEPFINNVIVGREAVIDATLWTHKLPREQK